MVPAAYGAGIFLMGSGIYKDVAPTGLGRGGVGFGIGVWNGRYGCDFARILTGAGNYEDMTNLCPSDSKRWLFPKGKRMSGALHAASPRYAPEGRRIQKVVSTNGVGIYTCIFLYDGWNHGLHP